MEHFNIRVYGILINRSKEILLSDEEYNGVSFTKFPGGGVCLGESLPDALRREFMEECDLEIKVGKLLHLTDTVVPSVFDNSQVIGAYYKVDMISLEETAIRMQNIDLGSSQTFRWVPLTDFSDKDLYFEMDRHAWQKVKEDISLIR